MRSSLNTPEIRRRIRFGDRDPASVPCAARMGNFVVESVLDYLSERLGGTAECRILDLGVLPPARAFSIEILEPLAWDDEIEIHVQMFGMAAAGRGGENAAAVITVFPEIYLSCS